MVSDVRGGSLHASLMMVSREGVGGHEDMGGYEGELQKAMRRA